MRELRKLLRKSRLQQRASAEPARNSSVGSNANDSVIGSLENEPGTGSTRDSRQNLTVLIRDVGEIYDRFRSDNEEGETPADEVEEGLDDGEDEELDDNDDDDEDEDEDPDSEEEETPENEEEGNPENNERANPENEEDQDRENQEDQDSDNADEDPDSSHIRYPSGLAGLNQDLINDYKRAARAEQRDGRWRQAWQHARRLVELSRECAEAPPFDNILEVYEMLVDILVHLKWWNEAFDRIEEMQNTLRSPSNNNRRLSREEIATIHYLTARVYFNRCQKNGDTKEHDLSNAYLRANRAFAIFHHNSRDTDDQTELIKRLSGQCTELLRAVLMEKGEEIEARGVWNWVDSRYPGLLTSARPDILAPENIYCQDNRGMTELMHAVVNGDGRAVSTLLRDYPAEYVNIADKSGFTALHHGVKRGDTAIAAELLLFASVGRERSTTSGETPLHIAVTKGHTQLVRMLLEANADDPDLLRRFEDDDTVLHAVYEHTTADITSQLISAWGENPKSFVNATNRFGRTALHECAQHGSYEQAKVLLKNGADVNAKTCAGKTTLSLALESKSPRTMVNLLLDFEVDTDLKHLSTLANQRLAHYKKTKSTPCEPRTSLTSDTTTRDSMMTTSESGSGWRHFLSRFSLTRTPSRT